METTDSNRRERTATDAPSNGNALTVFQFDTFPVRVTDKNGSPWFVAGDVCKAIAIRNSRDAIARLDEDERADVVLTDTRQRRKLNIISESGLYALILRSDKPEAKVFRKWVTSEVLPGIRRRGVYSACENVLPAAPEKPPLVDTIADMLRSLNERITARENVPAHILKYAWNLANVSRDVSMRGMAAGLLHGRAALDNAELGRRYETMLADAIDEAAPLSGMPPVDSDNDRVFVRSSVVNALLSNESGQEHKITICTIRNLADGNFIRRISKVVTRFPHHQASAIRRLSGLLWNPDKITPVRVLDINNGKIIEIDKD